MIASWGWNLGYFDFHDLISPQHRHGETWDGKGDGEKRTASEILGEITLRCVYHRLFVRLQTLNEREERVVGDVDLGASLEDRALCQDRQHHLIGLGYGISRSGISKSRKTERPRRGRVCRRRGQEGNLIVKTES
jgi:hypothetical protein